MTDHAFVVRQFVRWDAVTQEDALAALAALEQELADAKRLLALRDDAYKSSIRERAIARAEAAEAELAEAKRERDEWQRHAGTSDREVARLRVIVLSILAALALPRIDESLLWQDAGTAILGRVEEIIDQADVDVARAEAAEAERDEFGSDRLSLQQQISELVRTARSEQVRADKAEAALAGKEGT